MLRHPGRACDFHAEGEKMDEIFSAPKVQISRIVDKYLSDSPAGELQEVDIQREMSEVVCALVCFADHLLSTGTAAEYASKLEDRMRQDFEDHRIAWQKKVDEKRKRCVAPSELRMRLLSTAEMIEGLLLAGSKNNSYLFPALTSAVQDARL
jgi:hypothetical protein